MYMLVLSTTREIKDSIFHGSTSKEYEQYKARKRTMI